jgi:hypothetical protein
MIVPGDELHRFVIHDRDSIYAEGVDRTLRAMGLQPFGFQRQDLASGSNICGAQP